MSCLCAFVTSLCGFLFLGIKGLFSIVTLLVDDAAKDNMSFVVWRRTESVDLLDGLDQNSLVLFSSVDSVC